MLNNDDKKVCKIHNTGNVFYKMFINLKKSPPKELWMNLCIERELSQQYMIEKESTIKYILQDEDNSYSVDDITEIEKELAQLDKYQKKTFFKYKNLERHKPLLSFLSYS